MEAWERVTLEAVLKLRYRAIILVRKLWFDFTHRLQSYQTNIDSNYPAVSR